jgi:hypothetical protein
MSREGVFYPSVSEIVRYGHPDQFFCTPEQLERARIQGVENHQLVENYFEFGDTFGIKYLEVFDAWFKGIGLKNPHPEERIDDDALRVSGKPDMFFLQEGVLMDLKRTIGDPEKHALQLAGYSILIENKYHVEVTNWKIIQVMKTKVKVLDLSEYYTVARNRFLILLARFYVEN